MKKEYYAKMISKENLDWLKTKGSTPNQAITNLRNNLNRWGLEGKDRYNDEAMDTARDIENSKL